MKKIFLLILLSLVLISSAQASLLSGWNAEGTITTSCGPTNYRGEGFTANQTGTLGSVGFIFDFSTAHNVTVLIQNNTGGNLTGNGKNISIGSFTSSVGGKKWYNITMAATTITKGVNYTVLVLCPGGNNGEGPLLNDTGGFPDGEFAQSNDAGLTWSSGGGDLPFAVYSFSTDFSVALTSPSNGAANVVPSILFNASYFPTNLTLFNATIYVWNASNSLFNMTTASLSGNVQTSSVFNISGFVGGNYIWNVYACAKNDSGYAYCLNAPSNFTFTQGFALNNVTYNNFTYETSREMFSFDFSVSNIISASSVMVYNNSRYSTQTTCSSSRCTSNASFDIPLLPPSGQQNNSFYLAITVYDGTTSYSLNSSTLNQTVLPLVATYCGSGGGSNVSLNFTAYDEQNRTRINPFSFDGNFQYYTGYGSVYKNLSISNSTTNEVDICLGQNTTYYINSIIAYSAPNSTIPYVTRNYFHQNYPINQTKLNIPLYLLATSASTSFVLQVQDRFLLPVSGVLVNVQRCYPGQNNNETVFISRTDSGGLTTGNFEAETALYKFFITNNSQTILAVDQCSKVVPQTPPYTLAFQLGTSYSSPFTNINNATNINETLVFNYTNNILTLTYVDTSGTFSYASLIVKSLNYSGNNQPVVCSSNNTLPSGIITCNISIAGSYTAAAYVYRSNQILIDQITFSVQTFSSTVGYYGAFLGFFILLICCFAFKYNEIAGIILINVGVIFCNLVGLIAFGKVFITALACISIIIMAVLDR